MARFASARRTLLALAAVAALSLAGCGGGGSDDGADSTAGSQAQGTAANTTTSASKAKGSSPGSTSQGPANKEGAGADSSAPQGAGKHGKQIQLPEGEPEPTATPAEEAKATVADIALTSPAIGPAGALPATYTCDGKDTWPSLQWQGIPTDTQELILFAMNAAPVDGKLFFDWAIAGLPAGLEGLEEGKLPKGAVQGENGFGKTDYEICPNQGQAETYVFVLYAIPKRLAPAKGFDPHRLREEALAAVGRAGILAATYGRE